MSRESDNVVLVQQVQSWLRSRGHELDVDGWGGTATREAWRLETGSSSSVAAPVAWPRPDQESLESFYGPPGESRLIAFSPPYPMVLAWDPTTPVRVIRCHELVRDSLERVLASIGTEYDEAERAHHGLDQFGGCYAYRPMRDRADRWSLHAWGAAIDLDPIRNGLRTPWPATATMPVRVVELFEAEGWTAGARAWSRDAMHFQGTRWP